MKILLVEDHKLFSESLKNNLERTGEVTCTELCGSDKDIMEAALSGKFDLILMDINLKRVTQKDGLTLAEEVFRINPEIKIVILTGFDLRGYEMEAKRIGAKGFLSKEIGTAELMEQLRKVYNGGTAFDKRDEYEEPLTQKERLVLELYCTGLTRKEVAQRMNISMRTLANHLNVIYDKLSVGNYQEMLQKAMREGYIRGNF